MFEANMGMVTTSCRKFGITTATFYNWCKCYPWFNERVDVIQDSIRDYGECALLEKIKQGDTKAILFYCDRKLKDRGYVQRTEQQVNIDNSVIELEIK